MKVCSFLPAATAMIQDMGLKEFIGGVTFECPSDKPKVVRSILEDKQYSSREIDTIVSQAKAQGKSLYYIDEELLLELSPDIIFTQDVCDVCQIDTGCVQRAVSKLKKQPQVISLTPKNMNGVFDNVVTIGKALNKEENAYRLLARLKTRMDNIIDTLRENKAPLKRVFLMEWIEPIYNCGHWTPDIIAQAGGVDMLSNPSGYSELVNWNKIVQYDPEVLIIAPCGFKPERTIREATGLLSKDNWNELTAVKNNAVFIVDSDLFCPDTRLIQGIETLSALFHPDLFSVNDTSKVVSFEKVMSSV